MDRREFIALLSGGALARPLPARIQQPDRLRRAATIARADELIA